MDRQISTGDLMDERAQVRTKKKGFLEQIDRIVPWGEWVSINKGEQGNTPCELGLMLRLHVLQNLYDLSDEWTAAEVIGSRVFLKFCGIDNSSQVPDGSDGSETYL